MLHLPNKRLNPHKGSMIFAQFAAFGRSAAGSRRIGHFQPVGPIYTGDGALVVKDGSNATERILVYDSRRRKTRKTPTRLARDNDADAAGNAGTRDKKNARTKRALSY